MNDSQESEAMDYVLRLMSLSARTSPKTAGIDDILLKIVVGEEKGKVVEEMHRLGKERGIPNFHRDARSIDKSHGMLLIGIERNAGTISLNCGACGFDCDELDDMKKEGADYYGPNCAYKLLDLGIALGSAAKTASIMNADSRIMYRAATAAMRIGIFNDVSVALAIPISGTGKNVFFDR
ncbi:MAG: ferredoxin domain-containing protein [Candidatus Thorarchaeota archaeon]